MYRLGYAQPYQPNAVALCAKHGFLRPIVFMAKNGDLQVWFQMDGRPAEMIVPKRRWSGNWDKAKRYIRGHHQYWQLQARACERYLNKILEEPMPSWSKCPIE